VATRIDGRELIYIDRHVLHELHAPHAFESLENRPPGAPADLTFSMAGHTVSSRPGRPTPAIRTGALPAPAMREVSRRNGSGCSISAIPSRALRMGRPELAWCRQAPPKRFPTVPRFTVGGLARCVRLRSHELAHILATQVMALSAQKHAIRLDGSSPHK